ncbi:MAG TPA: M23 family metallopeptidase [Woeseiaceae bacterium]|jgi:murein DD-endopeptidase MepM/ murein hydrolase activator NlpD|nr:M23 family metallopeptidase [Woeseiaceae bacterium]
MNVVIFGKGFGKPRQVNLSGTSAVAAAIVVSGSLFCAAFAGGLWYAAQSGSGMQVADLKVLESELSNQRDAIATTRQQTEDTLDALAIRLGQMNARVIRLDALGRRLTEMANLSDGEFDFDSEPALGGPEEPYLSGWAVAVPEVLAAMQNLDQQLNSREAQLGALEGVLMGQNLVDRVVPQGRPVNTGWISSYFGRRTDPFTGKPANHKGVDFAGKAGAEIMAVADGVVTWSSKRYGYGELVEINHGNGYATRYAHNSENLVAVGDMVKKGQAVALMGDTGRATGPNLHFEVLQEGRPVNPVNFIRQGAE